MRKFCLVLLLTTLTVGVYISDRSSFIKPPSMNVAQGQELVEYDYSNDLYAYLNGDSVDGEGVVVEPPSDSSIGSSGEVKEVKTGIQEEYDTVTGKKYSKQASLNSDTVGWITIPDTNIDYPIMSYRDNQYYLNHDPNRNYNKCGSVFMDCVSGGKFGKITLLHGHNIKDGKIFAQLDKYAKERVFTAGNIIKVFDGTTERHYAPFSVIYIDANKESIPLEFKYSEGYQEYFKTLKERSLFSVETGDIQEVLLLQTCAYVYDKNSGKDGRLLLACYRVG